LIELAFGELTVAILIHAGESLIGQLPSCSFWAATALTFWAAHAFTFGRAAEAFTFWAATSFAIGAAHAFGWWAAGAWATHAHAHAFGHLFRLGGIDEAVGIGVDAAEQVIEFGGASFHEFVFADFAIAIGVGAFEHFGGVTASVWAGADWGAWALTFLGEGSGDKKGAGEQQAEQRMGIAFHGVVQLGFVCVWR
jgi:hypothetical protein